MPNPFFQFKQFTVHHDRCAMKVTTDACLFGAWVAAEMENDKLAVKHTLDIGAGTGLLSLMVAQKNEVKIDAVEIDREAAAQAAENVAASPWQKRICIHQHDVTTWKSSRKYDCVLSNPPFYENELRSAAIRKNLAHHSDGLSLDKLFESLNQLLTEEGIFYLLLPAKREHELPILLKHSGFHLNKKIHVRQSDKHDPFRLMINGSRNAVSPYIESEIIIRHEAGEYTQAFTALLKDYYLYL